MKTEECPFHKGAMAFDEQDSSFGHPAEKLDSMWLKILDNRVFSSGSDWPSMTSVLKEDYSSVYETTADTKEAKTKVLCSRGAVAKVRIEWFNHNKYTGLFKKADYGLIRLTSAFLGGNSIPSWLGSVSSSKIFPCCALKFFRNSQPHPHCTVQESRNDMGHSGNFLFGGKKTGQMEDDFFAHPVCTHLTEKINFVLSWILTFFRQYTAYATQLGVSDFAAMCEDGRREEEVVFPWCIALVPTAAEDKVRNTEGNSQSEEIPFIAQLLRLPTDSVIYDIYCIPTPKCLTEKLSELPNNAAIERIGRIVTCSEFVQSSYDQQIFFKHQRKEEDYALRPEWLGDLKGVHANTGSSFFEENIRRGSYVNFETR